MAHTVSHGKLLYERVDLKLLSTVYILYNCVTGDTTFGLNGTNKNDRPYHKIFFGSAWSFGFIIPATRANDLRLRRIFIPNVIHYLFYPILILEKEPVFSLFNVECQTRELLVPFL